MRKALLLTLCVVLISSLAFAGDPPARVARLSYLTGQVSIQPNGTNDWVEAGINRPLTSSDRVWADTDGRAELQLGGASLRLDNSTSLTLVNVSDNNVQLQLDQGTASLHVAELFDGEIYEVDTPNVSFIVRKRGDYRFDVDNAGDTTNVTVFRGEGDVTGDGPAVRVSKDERYTFTGGRSLRYMANHNPGLDGFDQWAAARAQREDDAVSARYVSRYAVGYSDLDSYGGWEAVPAYGSVWFPRTVAVGWAPYRWGHWVWVSPWGWTWVDDAPWGFAPYHYGRWVYYGSRWGWCPGPIRVRPVYAPALVAWVGGRNWGVGLSFGVGGGVGWFPLGWGEPYIPYYAHSRGYFQHVNVTNTRITNITYITNNYYGNTSRRWNYAYGHQPRAVTAVSNDNFRLSHPTRAGFVPVNERELRQASFERNIPVRPTTNSMLGPNAGNRRATPPATWARPAVAGRPSGPERRAVADAENPRPERIARPDRDGNGVRSISDNNNHPARNYPRPPERGNAVVTADNERPKAMPNPGHSHAETPNRTDGISDRVPRPPDRVTHSDHDANSPSRGNVAERNVPHPAENQAARPDHRDDSADRANRGPERNVPRPENQFGRSQENRGHAVAHDVRPQTPVNREERSAPRTEPPARKAESHAAPVNKRPPENKPNVERKTDHPREQGAVGYPRPYGNVRAASYTSNYSPRLSYSDYERSSQPRSFNSSNMSATRSASRSYSQPSRSSFSTPSRASSYSASARYEQPSARNYSHSSSGSRGNSSGAAVSSRHGRNR